MEPIKSQCVCTTLRMATRAVNRLYDRALAPAGLRQTGYSILSRLAEEGPLSIGELATRLAMERTTCTREVTPLVDAGLVEQTIGSDDRRRRQLQLTAEGRRRREAALPHWKSVQQRIAAEFGDDDLADLLARVHRLREDTDHLLT